MVLVLSIEIDNRFSEHYIAVITGGLDSKLITWDFSKGRPSKIVDFGMFVLNSLVWLF